MNRLARWTWVIVIAAAFAFTPADAQVAYNPQLYDIPLDHPGATYAFRLSNLGKEDKQVKVTVANWEMDDTNEVRVIPGSEQSLDQWIVVNPVEFVLKAGASQAVRFSVRPAIQLNPGEHRAMIFFDEVLPPQDPAKHALHGRFRIGAAVYGQVGTVTRTGTIREIRADDHSLTIRVASDGSSNGRFKGQYTVWKKQDFPGLDKVPVYPDIDKPDFKLPPGPLRAGLLPNNAVLPGTERNVSTEFGSGALTKGEYVVVLNGVFGDTPIKQTAEFSVPIKKSGG
jgi:fimbrial chaperone protein